MLVLVPVECAWSVELLFYRAERSGVIARLPWSPFAFLAVLRLVLVASSWRPVIVPASAVSVAWETGRDHVGSSVIIKIAPGSLSSSVEASVPAVIIVVAITTSCRDVCFVAYGVFSVGPIVGVFQQLRECADFELS